MKIKKSLLIMVLFIVVFVFASDSYGADVCSCCDMVYQSAINDAMIADEGEIYTNLTPIVESNHNLSWQGEGADKRVLMVVWTRFPSSYPVGQKVNTSWGDTWVTVYPEINNFFKNHPTADLDLRLRVAQLLGLPPDSQNSYFVEVWVKPVDLFRPAADSEINDTTAQIEFPDSTDPAYEKWFNDNIIYSYFPKRYPWTRLGYTYDWGNPKSEIGLSEYVIMKDSEVIVKSLASTTGYLNQ